MKRRGFLKRLLGAATAAVVSEKVIPDDGVALRSMAHPMHPAIAHETNPLSEIGNLYAGPGLAPIKAEGSTMAYDHLNAFDAIRDGVTDELLGPFETIEIELDEREG